MTNCELKLRKEENKEFLTMLLILSIPIIFQNFINIIVNLVDVFMVGQLGDLSIAAVGLGNQVYFILHLIMLGISSGIAIFMTQFWGRKDIEGLQNSLAFGLIILVPLMTLSTLLTFFFPQFVMRIFTSESMLINESVKYIKLVSISFVPSAISIFLSYALRSTDRFKYSFYATIIAISLNVVLNYFFIFGKWMFPEMGVVGAALATTIARIVQVLILIGLIYLKNMPIAIRSVKPFYLDMGLVKKLYKTSGYVFFNEMLYGIGTASFFAIYGRLGSKVVAAANIAKTIENFLWIFFWGFGASASVCIGKLVGSDQYDKAKRYSYKFIIVGVAAGVVLSVVLLVLSKYILSMFDVSKEVMSLSLKYLTIFAICIVFRGATKIVSAGVMRAGGDTKFVFMWDIIPLWISLLVSFVLGLYIKVPVVYVFIIAIGYDLIKALPLFLRIKSGKWIHNVVK